MKVLLTGDWHITNKNPKFKRDNNGVSDLLEAQLNFVEWLKSLLLEDHYDMLIFLGDLTHVPTLDPLTLTYLNRMLKSLVDVGKPLIFLEGNHCITDTENTFTIVGASNELIKEDHCHFVYKQEMLEIDGVRFYCFPYNSDYDSLTEDIRKANENLDSDYTNLLLYHFPCSNAVLDNGIQSKKGIALTDDIAGNFDGCYGGDFHKHQKLPLHHNAWYVGAPFDLNHGEHYDRGVMSLDIPELDFKVLNNPYQIPIIEVTQEEFKGLSKELLQNSVIKVTDSDEKFVADLKKLETYNVITLSGSKTKKSSATIINHVSVKNYKGLRREVALNTPEEDREGALNLFDKVKN
ncbi:MAG: hypothetical protein CL489_16560 [Acidobacteria bacterium]|nr:hypothetical protein [Acidobacteriota bacterium]|tara:strand:+ start:1805 stop:2851 length:1047 start_codon:yes stop_codon:yes gene_type:complete